MGDNHTDCQYILTTYHDEMMRLAQWEYCQYDYDFLGFLDVYQNLNIPKDFIILERTPKGQELSVKIFG